jgi:hypothetical protein
VRSTMISGVAIISILVMLSPLALAVENVPGVAKGQFAEYSITYESDIPDEGAVDLRPYWYKLQVVNVSGTEVAVQLSAKIKDGSAVEGSGGYFVLDVENGAVDGWQSSSGPLGVYPRFLLMAKNVFYSSLPDQKLFKTGMRVRDYYQQKQANQTRRS